MLKSIDPHAISYGDRLRVLHLVPSLSVGGAEQMAGHLMLGLASTHDVIGAALYPASNGPIEASLNEAGIPLYHLGKRPGFDPKMFLRLDDLLRNLAPDVVHTHLAVLRYLLPVLFRRSVPLVVHTLHNLAEYESDAVGILIQRLAFRRRVLPVAISKEVADSVERVYGLHCEDIVPNCIPVGKYDSSPSDRSRWREANGFKESDVLFTCVARLEEQKNPLMLIRAFSAIKDPRAYLMFAGDGSLKAEMDACIDRYRLRDAVRLLGKRHDIPAILAASDVFVLASNWEGNPLAVMEAMAAGLPVISTRVGGVPELVTPQKHGILIEPEDCEALEDALRTLLIDVPKRLAQGAAARQHALSAFSIQRMVQGYSAVYRKALGKTSKVAQSVTAVQGER